MFLFRCVYYFAISIGPTFTAIKYNAVNVSTGTGESTSSQPFVRLSAHAKRTPFVYIYVWVHLDLKLFAHSQIARKCNYTTQFYFFRAAAVAERSLAFVSVCLTEPKVERALAGGNRLLHSTNLVRR